MFDINPDAMKYHLKDIGRQVAASRRPRGARHLPAQSGAQATHAGSLVRSCGRFAVRAFATAVRRAVAAVL